MNKKMNKLGESEILNNFKISTKFGEKIEVNGKKKMKNKIYGTR